MRKLLSMLCCLGCVAIASGALMAFVNSITQGPIAEAAAKAQIEAVGQVLPPFDNDPVADGCIVDEVQVFPAYLSGRLVGTAVEVATNEGFSGEIRLMVGFDAEGRVTGYTVLQHSETAGLGAKMGEWFQSRILGLQPVLSPLRVSKDGGQIDGITAATITSRAFLSAVNTASQVSRKFISRDE